MAKTTAPKVPAKSSAGTKGKSKRAAQTVTNGASKVMPATFPMPTGAFTVEQPPDPGPAHLATRLRRFRTSSKSRI